jgi:hypothetical protein
MVCRTACFGWTHVALYCSLAIASISTGLFATGVHPTTVANPGSLPQNYGGYIVPGSTLDDMRILVSQWHVPMADGHPTGPGSYNVQEFAVNVNQ